MVTLARRAQRIPFAPVVAVLFGVAAAVLVAAVPQWMFEDGVVASGLPSIVAAAAPPLGFVARVLAIGLAFVVVAAGTWIILAPLTRYFEAKARARTPWRDAGYDFDADGAQSDSLPPRRPIFAPDELGAPLMSDEAIAPVIAPVQTVQPPAEHPIAADGVAVERLRPADNDRSIAALLRRLEDGLARREARQPDPDGPGPGSGGSEQAVEPDSDELAARDSGPEPSRDADDDTPQAFDRRRRVARY